MKRESQICAIIDFQGFFIQRRFYPRELSIVNDEYQLCFEVLPEISSEIKLNNFKHFSYQQHQLHGIPLEKVLSEKTKKIIPLSQLRQLIEEIYFRVRSEDKKLLGVKNQQVGLLLKEYQIPFFNFEAEEVGGEICPALAVFEKFKFSTYCLLHSSLKRKFNESHRCALRKSQAIWSWLTVKLRSDFLVDEIFTQTECAHTSEDK